MPNPILLIKCCKKSQFTLSNAKPLIMSGCVIPSFFFENSKFRPSYQLHKLFLKASLDGNKDQASVLQYVFLEIDGQLEVVKRGLGKLLWCLVHDHIDTLELVLPMAKFAYNNI